MFKKPLSTENTDIDVCCITRQMTNCAVYFSVSSVNSVVKKALVKKPFLR
jgi:hypothetical protein